MLPQNNSNVERAPDYGRLLCAVFGFLLAALLAGCASSLKQSDLPQANSGESLAKSGLIGEYQIGVGDSLRVSVWRNPDLSADVVVLPDGKIAVPLVGDVMAAGETTESLAKQISTVLSRFIREPNVTVSVLNAASSEYLQRVRITGAVNQPQSLVHRRGLTVLDVVLQAGGLTPFAKPNKAILYRREEGGIKAYPVRLDDILNEGELETNYVLLPSDIISVPEGGF